jgi:hypothetical protein
LSTVPSEPVGPPNLAPVTKSLTTPDPPPSIAPVIPGNVNEDISRDVHNRKIESKRVYRARLSANTTKQARIIIIALSSGPAPAQWLAGKTSLAEDLPIWGRAILKQFQRCFDITSPAVIIAGERMRPRKIPAVASQSDRHRNHIVFTKAIEDELNATEDPIIVSAGWDGAFCNTKLLGPWLERMPKFTWYFRIHNLAYDPDVQFHTEYDGRYWTLLDSKAILSDLRHPEVLDADLPITRPTTHTIRIWNLIQFRKDRWSEEGLTTGPNRIGRGLSDDDIDHDDEE